MRFRLAAIATTVVLLGFVAPPVAQAAPPAAPVRVSPADDSAVTGTRADLSVTASDPDGGGLDVRFEGRRAGATVSGGDPFTIVALPDVQNYTNSGRQGYIAAQAQWAVDTRTRLNTALVVQLGDLVNNYDNATQWGYTSTGLQVLDDAGMPNTVVPGNHDFDTTTGDAPLYNTVFGSARYTGATWTPGSASYGGYLGQNLFGPDPINRGNQDNFALFSAGGEDFLVLNLEWEAPQYALDWGTRVLAAYPDRIVILVTHAFLAESGNRSTITERTGGTPPNTIWTNFVYQNCAIRLVLNGHYHNTTGEARRTDANRCGNPVTQALSNYQDRPNGGDGWLRYYTFDPTADTMTAFTYSPTLDQYETDDNSAFTVPFELPDTLPAPFTTIGTVHLASPGTANLTWSGLDTDTAYEWRVVADDGTDATTSDTWRLHTVAPAPTELARDGFNRTGSRWGAADVGGAWTDSGASYFATDGATGQVTISRAGSGPSASLPAVSGRDVSITTDFALASAPTGGPFIHITQARVAANTYYALNSRIEPGGALRLYLSRVVSGAETQLRTTVVNTFGYTAGERVKVRFDVTGNGTTTLEGRLWRASGSEPSNPMVSVTDTTAVLQGAGAVALKFYAGGGTTSLPTRVSVDGYSAVPPGGGAPDQPPVASFTSTTQARQVSVDASASTDDGTITSYAWDYGDGTTGTGRTDTHTYATDGTRTITLTVTDNSGQTGTKTTQVTLADQPPVASFTATTQARQVSVDASASTDDGTITDYAWDYGDGTTGTGRTDTHTYATDGTRTITFTVTDNSGQTATTTKPVTVQDLPPTASFTATPSGLKVSVDASASTDDGTITDYAWDYGDGTTGTGRTATHTYTTDGTYTLTLTITDNANQTATTTKPVTVSAPPASNVLADDAFSRSVASGWGSADTGGAWTVTSNTMFSVAGGRGLVTIPAAGKGPVAWLSSVSARDVSITTDFALDKVPTGSAYTHQVLARMNGTSTGYLLVSRVNSNGSIQFYVSRLVSGSETQLKSVTFSSFGYAAGDRVKVRLDVTGSSPTSISGRLWRAGEVEPGSAQVSVTDSAGALQSAGAVGVKAYSNSGLTSLPIQVSVGGFSAIEVGA